MNKKEKWTLQESEEFEDFVTECISMINESMKDDIIKRRTQRIKRRICIAIGLLCVLLVIALLISLGII